VDRSTDQLVDVRTEFPACMHPRTDLVDDVGVLIDVKLLGNFQMLFFLEGPFAPLTTELACGTFLLIVFLLSFSCWSRFSGIAVVKDRLVIS
jgi:hypothetical protein